ncbi:MAG: 50S ribosomal protein L21 [Candidatus Riflebacteria bacterium]|nr:50S ribosomal protein L21 [Candidatus Riflebacteria bacterium]
MYAIIEVCGKQFSVEKGSKIRCEKMEREANDLFSVEKVLLLNDGQKVQIGQPYLSGVDVKARVVSHGRGAKLVGMKYKNKTNYRRKYGHRQDFTAIQIEEIKA